MSETDHLIEATAEKIVDLDNRGDLQQPPENDDVNIKI
jgi:hypothetical protein